MYIQAIRGAITVDRDLPDEIFFKTKQLLSEIIQKNGISVEQIISIVFTATNDIKSAYPAKAARDLGMKSIPLICCQEMEVKDSLTKCIRVFMHVEVPEKIEIYHVYKEGAILLRPDLIRPEKLTIAIDGPAGAGKSTIAKMVAKRLDLLYLDTGAMYRAIGLKMINKGINIQHQREEVISELNTTNIDVSYDNGQQIVFLDGNDVTNLIRTPQVSRYASDVAVIPEVRLKLVEIQRNIADKNSVVIDGRDIGTFVIPNADKKFFLTASLEERAKRRWRELNNNGYDIKLEDIILDIKNRDECDSRRTFAPLKMADDAILIDTTDKSINQVINEILNHIFVDS